MSSHELIPLPDKPRATGMMSARGRREINKQIERVVAMEAVAEADEQARALLANTALQNAGALSAMEAHLIEIAPLGEARYKHIVDAYALGATQKIARW